MIIQKNIPVPEKNPGRNKKYDFESMAVGDSFVAEKHEKKGHSPKAYNAAVNWGKGRGIKFAGRNMPDGTFRVWRVS